MEVVPSIKPQAAVDYKRAAVNNTGREEEQAESKENSFFKSLTLNFWDLFKTNLSKARTITAEVLKKKPPKQIGPY